MQTTRSLLTHDFPFVVTAWSAWRGTPASASCGAPAPLPAQAPKLLQRRLSPLARAVLHCIGNCIAPNEKLPAVFSSSHGEIGKCLALLETLKSCDELSPTAFSLSVHNAIAGLFSIFYGNRHEITAIAPGAAGLGAGFLEALGLLRQYQTPVLLVFYDEILPAVFPVAPFRIDSGGMCVLALKLSLQGEGQTLRFGFSEENRHDGEQPLQLPFFIDFLDTGLDALRLGEQGLSWQWQKI